MYSYLGQDGKLALRLPAPDRDRFLQTYGATLRMAHGRIQAEYVEVPDALFSATEELMPYFEGEPQSDGVTAAKAPPRNASTKS